MLLLPVVDGLQCFYCGPYLSASSQQCKGQPKAVECAASKGCIFNHAKKEDGTFFVEKRCSYLEENNNVDGECIESVFDGVSGKQCFCTTDLCNAGSQTAASLLATVFTALILTIFI